MNQYLDKEGGTAVEIKRAVLRSRFFVLNPALLALVCTFALVFAACDTGTGDSSSSTSGSGSGTSRAVDTVSFDIQSQVLIPGESFTLEAKLNPVNASNKKVSWTSSDDTVAEVVTTVTGLTNTVLGKKVGTATITVSADNGTRTATCVVDVRTVQSISVVAGSYQEYYDPNEEFNTEGKKLLLDVVYSNGMISEKPIDAVEKGARITFPTDWRILSSPLAPGRAASEPHPITVEYGGVKGTFNVTFRAVRWATIIGTPKKTVYNVGEPFDPEGLTITASYDVGPNKTGIPLTPAILRTANNFATWNDNSAVALDDQAFLGEDTGTPATDGFEYVPGVRTSRTGVNLTTLNGTANIAGLTISDFVVKIEEGVDKYRYLAPNAGNAVIPSAGVPGGLFHAFNLAAGHTATITVSDTTSAVGLDTTQTIKLSSSSKIRLVGYPPTSRVALTQGTAGTGNIFQVTSGATLTVENFALNSYSTSGGILAPLVEVSGAGSEFTLAGTSTMSIDAVGVANNPMALAGVMAVLSGKATIEEGAVITIDPTNGSRLQSYTGTPGIFVGPEGTLVMNGGRISGAPAPSSTGTFVGVGDVVVAGALELGGNAYIQRLALAASAPVEKPLVTIKDNWNPTPSFVLLNLTGSGTTQSIVQGFFVGKQLFTGAVATKWGNFTAASAATGGNVDPGGFFYSNGTTGSVVNSAANTANPWAMATNAGVARWGINEKGELVAR